MSRIIKLIDTIFGKTGVHITDTSFNFIKKNIDCKNIPREGEIIYFGKENYEVAKVLHNYENYRHTVFITVVILPHKVIADVEITFNKDK